MRSILNKYASDMERSIKLRGIIPSAAALTGAKTLVAVEDQYDRASKAFSKTFRREVEKSNPYIFERKDIEDDVAENLASFIATSSITRSSLIVGTTQSEAEQAVIAATLELIDQELELTDAAIAERSKEIFKRKVPGRANTIAITETQNAAEGTKAIEVETVVRSPDVQGVETVIKTWESILDGNERETHHEADGQEIDSALPFSVGNSQLLFPGDSSQGAELKETINCRCSATYKNVGIQ